ncbi:MAG TPA: transposase [Acidimicrobiales bacterium]|nr:transposase [Acidimicrobiales bacterium]
MAAARCRSFRFKLSPTARQEAALVGLLGLQCELYNAALEERRGAWRWEQRSVTYMEQCRTLTGVRGLRPEVLAAGVTVCRGTLRRLDRAFAAFYRRCKAGQRPGFPRFRPLSRWNSLQWEDRKGWRIDEAARRLYLQGVGALKVRLHRPLRGTAKAITVRREGRRWWVTIRCVDIPAEPLVATGRQVGLDLGVTVLVATSQGDLLAADRPAERAAARLASAQRALATKQRGSKQRRRAAEHVAEVHRHIRNRRADTLHKLSRRLVDDHDLIVHEALVVSNLVRRPKPKPDPAGGYQPNGAAAKTVLNRSIHDAGWGQLLAMIAYKAESAGRTVIAVDPRNTSRTCAHCGHVSAGNRRGAVFECQACGHLAHADTNAAVNILRAGRAQRHTAAQGRN